MSSEKHVFISHAVGDAAFAERLAQLMRERGVSTSRGADRAPGVAWPEMLRHQVEKSAALVLVIPSDKTPNRNNLWFEAGAARALGRRVLGVLPPGGHLIELPGDLADILVLDTDQRSLDSIADTLSQAVPELDLQTI